MLSSTVTTSSSISNTSVLTDSSAPYDSNQESKRRRKKIAPKQFNSPKTQFDNRPDRPTLYNHKNVSNKHLKKDGNNRQNQEVPVNSFNSIRRSCKSTESSEVSSNNLTCSELDAVNSNGNNMKNDVRLQRRKYIKCVLREDVELLVNFNVFP